MGACCGVVVGMGWGCVTTCVPGARAPERVGARKPVQASGTELLLASTGTWCGVSCIHLCVYHIHVFICSINVYRPDGVDVAVSRQFDEPTIGDRA